MTATTTENISAAYADPANAQQEGLHPEFDPWSAAFAVQTALLAHNYLIADTYESERSCLSF